MRQFLHPKPKEIIFLKLIICYKRDAINCIIQIFIIQLIIIFLILLNNTGH